MPSPPNVFFLFCQAIWNYAIDCRKLSDVIEVDHLNELEDILVYLLEAYNESTMNEAGRYFLLIEHLSFKP